MSKSQYRIAVIPGDGIGKEVMPEALRTLDAVSKRFGIALEYQHIEWASCDYYAAHGQMMPDDWKAQLETADAILFGAVGWPQSVPDHVSLWGRSSSSAASSINTSTCGRRVSSKACRRRSPTARPATSTS